MHSLNYDKTQILAKLFLLFTFTLFSLIGCSPDTEDPLYATWTPSPTITPTCAPNMRLTTPEVLDLSTRLIVILYDPRVIGDQYLELANGEKTKDVPHFISSIVPMLMKPGDQVSAFYLGYSSYNDAKVARLYSYMTPPLLYNTPSPRSTLTPLPPTKVPTPGFGEVATKNAIKIESTVMAGTEIANQAVYDCEVKLWNDTVQTTAATWNSTATAEISEISNDLDAALKDISTNARGKTFQTDELYYGGMYYGLSFASTIFQSDCKEYDNCILLIIDDMHYLGKNNPDNLSINLEGVKAYVIMPNCLDIDEAGCKSLEDYWNKEFLKFGATQPVVYWNGVRAEINLLDTIGR